MLPAATYQAAQLQTLLKAAAGPRLGMFCASSRLCGGCWEWVGLKGEYGWICLDLFYSAALHRRFHHQRVGGGGERYRKSSRDSALDRRML